VTETLYIRLGSQKQDIIHWLIWSASEYEIIASGELDGAEQLTELSQKSEQRKVVVLVPGCDLAIKRLNVPGKSQRAIKLAAPYMLEDELAQDVEQLFFAYASNKTDAEGHNCFLAAVDRTQMDNWLAWLADAAIKCKVMLPDVLAMPVNTEGYSAIMLGEQVLLRQSEWQGLVVDAGTWPMVAGSIAKQWQKVEQESEEQGPANPVIDAYSELPGREEQAELIDIQAKPEELPLALLAKHAGAQQFNLLQDEYQVKEKRSPVLVTWYWAAGIALFALLLNFGIKAGQLVQLNAQQEMIEQEIIASYKKAFPQSKRVRVATIKSQLRRKLSEVGSGNSSEGFLEMLAKVQPAFSSVRELKPESLKYDGKRQEMRIQAVARDYQYFDKFKTEVEKAKLTVNLGSQTNQGEQVSGSFSISSKAKGGR